MKYINIILTIIAFFLMVISLKLTNLDILLRIFNENTQILLQSNQQVIDANQRFEGNMADFKKQIEGIDRQLKKE